MSSHASGVINRGGIEDLDSDSSEVEQDTSRSDPIIRGTDFVSNKKQRCDSSHNKISLCQRVVNDLSGNEVYEACYQSYKGYTYVTDDEARLISQALRTNTTIEILGFKGFQFTSHGFGTLVDGVVSCRFLQHLKLEGLYPMHDHPVDIAQIQVLANNLKENNSISLSGLELGNYNIGCEGMISIFESLLNNSVIDTIVLNNNIEEFDDTGSEDDNISSQGESDASTLPSVSQVGGVVANVLQRNTTLLYLDLSFNPLGNEFVVIIADVLSTNSTLNELILNQTDTTDAGAIALALALKSNATLQGLNLNGNTFSKVGLLAFGDALKVNKSLISLEMLHHPGYDDVESNLVSPRNVDFSYLATFLKVLEYNTTLQSLGVFDEDIDFESFLSDESKQIIISSLEYNDTITDFSGGTESAPESIQKILRDNGSKTRVAPKKGGHNRRTIYDWLSHNVNQG